MQLATETRNLPQRPLTIRETAAFLSFHPESVRRAVRQKRIAAVKVGAGWRVPAGELDRIAREGLPATVA